MKKKVLKNLMVMITGVLLGLMLLMGNPATTKAYAEGKGGNEYTQGCYKIIKIDNDALIGEKKFGRSVEVEDYTYNGVYFSSVNDCHTDKGIQSNRSFVIDNNGYFKFTLTDKSLRIRAIEFIDGVKKSVKCLDSNYNNNKSTGKANGDEYILFSNYDAEANSLEFQAGSEGFEFQDVVIYCVSASDYPLWFYDPGNYVYMEYPLRSFIGTDYINGDYRLKILGQAEVSYDKTILEVGFNSRVFKLTPIKTGDCKVTIKVPADKTSSVFKWTIDVHVVHAKKLTLNTYVDGVKIYDVTRPYFYHEGPGGSVNEPAMDEVYYDTSKYYRIPNWYSPTEKKWYTISENANENFYIMADNLDKEFSIYYYSVKHEPAKTSCVSEGTKEYWYVNATVLNKTLYFKDASCKEEITDFNAWKAGEGKIAATGHNLSYTKAKAATCTEMGCKEYWFCSNCNKYFSDKNCKNQISDINAWKKGNGKIDAIGHTTKKADAKAATCTEPGCNEYWYCSVCNKYFSDVNCKNQISDINAWKNGDGKIDAIGHDLEKTDAVASTYTEPGCKEYWHCLACYKYYADVKCEEEISNIVNWIKNEGRIEMKENPTDTPSDDPEPTVNPTAAPSDDPEPTVNPTAAPSGDPEPTVNPTAAPSDDPEPIVNPTAAPSGNPEPIVNPTATPSGTPTQAADEEITVIGRDDKETPTEDPTPDSHVCKGEAVAEVPATCTESGTKAYYKCECNKCYEDEACTKEIEDLNAWLLAENGGKISAKGHTVVTDKAVTATAKKNGLTEGTHCSECNAVLTAQVQTVYTKDGIVTITSKNTVAYVAPVKTSVKTTEVPTSVKIKGKTYKVTAIREGAFKNCKKLTTVTVGSNVTAIGANAFAGCAKLKTVKLNSKIKTIEENAFSKCTSLTEIVIPDKVTEIADNAFNGCTKLKKVTIGKSVKVIGEKAFNGCKKLTTVKILSSKLTKVSTDAFKGISSKAKVTAPSKKVASYKKLIKASGAPSKVSITKN